MLQATTPVARVHLTYERAEGKQPHPTSKLSQNVPPFCPAMDLSRFQTPLPIQGGHQQPGEPSTQTLPSYEHVEDPQRRLTYGRQKMLRLLTNVYSYLIEKASHSLPSHIFFSGQGQSSVPCKLLKTHIKCFYRFGSVSSKTVFFLQL